GGSGAGGASGPRTSRSNRAPPRAMRATGTSAGGSAINRPPGGAISPAATAVTPRTSETGSTRRLATGDLHLTPAGRQIEVEPRAARWSGERERRVDAEPALVGLGPARRRDLAGRQVGVDGHRG